MTVRQPTSGTSSGGVPPGALEEVLGRIESAVGDLADLVGPEVLDGWDAPSVARLAEAHTRVRRVTGRLDGVRYTLLPRIEDEGSWRSGGMSRTFTSWLRVREGVAAATARKEVATARRLATALPATRERLVSGALGADHARVMTEVAPTSETRQDALAWLVDTRTGEATTPEQFVQSVAVDFPDPADDPDGTRTRERITQVLEDAIADGALVTGEGLVLREAGALNADQFRTVARRFATVTDPDTDDVEDDKAAKGEYLDLAKTFGGYHVEGFLTDEHGLLLSTAVNAVTGSPAAEDNRTPGQRRAQAVADVARLVLDANEASPGAAIAPHLNVTVSWTELVTQVTRSRDGLCLSCGHAAPGSAPSTPSGLLSAGGPVFTETGVRVPRAVVRRLACDSAITRIVFGPDGAALDVGRAQRTVTGQMRRAVIARDKHCVFPGCDQPASRCEVHHAVTHWADGGSTSVSNSALLCWHHHQLVDARGIVMHWTGKPTAADGAGTLLETGWAFTDAHGRRIRLPEAIEPAPEPDNTCSLEPPGAAA
ncbi:hypothetical protein GCM10023198_26390 [Promicromonospora umidemergens]|uniref:HNH nuclease domain-containing protein n=1 Tax=Promicromonospora umidemergens TaxID=629679 RepID=A0ABP8X9J3_9MICO